MTTDGDSWEEVFVGRGTVGACQKQYEYDN